MVNWLLSDLDIVFLSYDEPQADHFFNWLKNLSPHEPLRVHGVKGFDSAHKIAANLVQTPRFITVDADNLVRSDLFLQTVCDNGMEDVVFSFKSRNDINGLEYGNGGVKVWNRDLVLNLNTHENSTDNKPDFCWTHRYFQIDYIGSDCQPNHSEYHAFRAGFRESVKMSLVRGEKLPDWNEYRSRIDQTSWSRLLTWCSVGSDVKNGIYAIVGARLALIELWINNLDPTVISDYDWFKNYWESLRIDIDRSPWEFETIIKENLDLEIPMLEPKASRWFKEIYINPPRYGLMV